MADAHVPKLTIVENVSPAVHATPHRTKSDPEAPKYERNTRKPWNSNPSSPYHQSGDKKASRTTGEYDRNSEQSPLHLKSATKDTVSSPSSEKRGPSSDRNHGHAPNTPGRSRFGADEAALFLDRQSNIRRLYLLHERISVVPEFGKWEEDPSSAGSYTDIFNTVKKEKESGSAKVPIISTDAKYPNSYEQDKSFLSSSCCCFSWCKK